MSKAVCHQSWLPDLLLPCYAEIAVSSLAVAETFAEIMINCRVSFYSDTV